MSPEQTSFRQRTRFIIKLGRALHECGSTSERIERHLGNVTEMLGLHGNFLVSPTTFTCAFWEDDELDQFVHIERVEPGDYNLGRLWEIDRLVENIEMGKVNFEDGLEQLKAIGESPPHYSLPINIASWFLTGGCFSILVSPNLYNAIASAIISIVIFLTVRQVSSSPRWAPLAIILAAITAGLLGSLTAAAGLPTNPALIGLSAIIIFIPGFALNVALSEISAGHLISGCSRLVDALMVFLKLFFGAATGIALTNFFFSSMPQIFSSFKPLADLPSWLTWPALLGLALALGIALNIPFRKIGWAMLSLINSYSFATLGGNYFGAFAGIFLGALATGIFANLFSRLTRGPSSVIITCGIIVLVPGSKIFSMLNQWVSGESILPGESGSAAVMVFITLTAGILFSNALLPPKKTL